MENAIMAISGDDLDIFIRAGLLGLISLAFWALKHLYMEFRALQREMMEAVYKDRLLLKDIQATRVKVEHLQKTINQVLSIALKQQNVRNNNLNRKNPKD